MAAASPPWRVEVQKSYLEACQPFISSGRIKGIRLSTRPDCISREILAFLRDHQVETIELGVQSMDDSVLMRSGRGHTAADTIHAVTLLREQGFSIGLQLMPGLPGDAAGTFMETVHSVIGMRPEFVRIYPALVIKETPLEALYCSGQYAPLSLDEAVQWCKNAFLQFERAGIAVIRMGLQPTEELQKTGTILAGPYHPAFRQLVDSSVLLDRMRAAVATACAGSRPRPFPLPSLRCCCCHRPETLKYRCVKKRVLPQRTARCRCPCGQKRFDHVSVGMSVHLCYSYPGGTR